jgi:cytochrome c553
MRSFLRATAIWAGLGAIGAAATVGLALFNVSARIEHFPPVSWLLHTTFEQNVRLRAPSPSEIPPDLDESGLVAIGVGHYDSACRFCHAAPGEAQTATAVSMNPTPPHISEAAGHWEPNQLHWIIDNGVKMSGMPHWPTEERSDDIWAVVAFLAQVPGMTAKDYAALREAPGEAVASALPGLAYCAGCHGTDGRAGGNPYIPRLDIQSEAYLRAALEAYRSGKRESGIMRHAATRLPESWLVGLAAHFSAQQQPSVSAATPPAEGEALATGTRSGEVPSCRACHGPWPEPRNPAFPEIAGQHEKYIVTQLRLWRDHMRGGNRHQDLMAKSARNLDDDQIKALAAYYAALPPSRTAEPPDEASR